MRMQMTSQIDAGGNDPIFLMFHGYGNDESEMGADSRRRICADASRCGPGRN